MDPMYIILIVKIRNVLNVNRLGDYICVCLTRVALTELETVGNDSCSIPEEEEEEEEESLCPTLIPHGLIGL